MIDYNKGIKKALKLSVQVLRNDINKKSTQLKIENYCKKWDDNKTEVINLIMTDDRFARTFIIDPKKQNIYEKLFLNYVNKKGYNITNLINKGKEAICLENGNIRKGSATTTSTKSMDFIEVKNNKTIYYYHKYTNECGGAQDNQYRDMIHFITEASKVKNNNILFIALCDGDYYTKEKIEEMKSIKGSNTLIKCSYDY